MKKTAIIIVLLGVMLFSIFSVASAESESKEDYFEEIATYLHYIEENLSNGKYAEAKEESAQLRACVYRCARFLAQTQQYDIRIMWVINYAEKAFMVDDFLQYIILAQNTAAEVLLGSVENGHNFDFTWIENSHS